MNLSIEQAQQLQEKLAANKNPEEAAKIAAEYGIDLSAEAVEQILDKVSGGVQALSDDALENISGGENVNPREVPQFQILKDYYKHLMTCDPADYPKSGGNPPNLTFILCIYYIPSPICYEIVQVIEEDFKHGK